MNTFKVNGKEYKAKAFDFNMICDLEDLGITMEQAGKKPMGMTRAYFALCAGMNAQAAGKEMEAHIVNGGKFDDVTEAMSAEMEKSDFFRNLGKEEKEEVATVQGKTNKEK